MAKNEGVISQEAKDVEIVDLKAVIKNQDAKIGELVEENDRLKKLNEDRNAELNTLHAAHGRLADELYDVRSQLKVRDAEIERLRGHGAIVETDEQRRARAYGVDTTGVKLVS